MRLLPALLLAVGTLCCADGRASRAMAQPDPLAVPARQWVVDVARNEVNDLKSVGVPLRYRSHTVNTKGDTVRDVIESADGTVARLILRDNKPISADEDKAERERLQTMLDSPDAFAKHVHSDDSAKKTAIDVIHQMPDAMLYEYTPGQPQRQGLAAGSPAEIVIDFKPNPAWSPPSLATDALTGIEGRLWADPRSHHLVRLEAHVFKPVSVGFGLFAKIFPGGGIALDETQVNAQRWIYNHFQESITVRALMVKTIRQNSEARASDYLVVPSTNYRDAIHLLLDTPLPSY